MRTTLAEHASDRRSYDAGPDERVLERDNPRRRREPEPSDERENDTRHAGGTSRSPLRHGVQHG
jgi:hypothetical protein